MLEAQRVPLRGPILSLNVTHAYFRLDTKVQDGKNEAKVINITWNRTRAMKEPKNEVRITPQEEQSPVKGQLRNSHLPSSLNNYPLFNLAKVSFSSEIISRRL